MVKCDQGRGHAGSFLQVSMKPRWWSEVQMVSQVTENGGRSQKYKTDLGVLWLKWQPQPLETIHQEPSYGQGSQSGWLVGFHLRAVTSPHRGASLLGSSLCPPPSRCGDHTSHFAQENPDLYIWSGWYSLPCQPPKQCTDLDISCMITSSMVTELLVFGVLFHVKI